MDIREEKAWLLQSRVNPCPVSGSLALEDGRLSFTLDEDAADAPLDWLAAELDDDGLRGRVKSGEPVVAFDLALADCAVSWPITGGGATMIVRTPARKWVVTYDYPSGSPVGSTFGLLAGRRRAREWKKALAHSAG